MRRVFNRVTVLLLLAGLALSACASAPGGGKCKWGVCIDLELAEPIGWNEPVDVTIIVETEEDIQGLKNVLWFSDPDILVEGEREWIVNTKSHTPMQFSTTIRFPPREGYYSVYAGAQGPRTDPVQDAENVQITTLGGTLNPPSEPWDGTPILIPRRISPPSTPAQGTQPPTETPWPTSTPHSVYVVADRWNLNDSIPDDGTWLTYTLPITTAPPDVTVTAEVSVKFLVVHPRAQDLVVEIVGPDGATVHRVWDRKAPTPEDFYEGDLLPRVYGITAFDGQPINGNWTFRIRDETPGQVGTLIGLSLAVGYLRPASSLSTSDLALPFPRLWDTSLPDAPWRSGLPRRSPRVPSHVKTRDTGSISLMRTLRVCFPRRTGRCRI